MQAQRQWRSSVGGASSNDTGERDYAEHLRHEHRAPATAFSELAFSQLQLRADCLPQEHLA